MAELSWLGNLWDSLTKREEKPTTGLLSERKPGYSYKYGTAMPLDAGPGSFESMSSLQKAAITTSAIPVVGDIAGLASDIEMYSKDPESRTAANYGLSAIGLLPFVPSAGIFAKATPEQAAMAEKMADEGASSSNIWEATGATKLSGSEPWLREINPQGMRLKEDVFAKQKQYQMGYGDKPTEDLPFETAMDYPELLQDPVVGEAAKQFTMRGYPGYVEGQKGLMGYADLPSGRVDVAGAPEMSPAGNILPSKSVAQHEIDHMIANEQGLSFGFNKGLSDDMSNYIGKREFELNVLNMPEKFKGEKEAISKAISKIESNGTDYLYWANPGEGRARLSQFRSLQEAKDLSTVPADVFKNESNVAKMERMFGTKMGAIEPSEWLPAELYEGYRQDLNLRRNATNSKSMSERGLLANQLDKGENRPRTSLMDF